MRFRLGLFLGLAIGYVLGAKAGTRRYEQIQKLWQSVSGSEPGQQIGEEVRMAANRAGDALEQKASQGVEKVTDMVHGESKAGNGRTPPA